MKPENQVTYTNYFETEKDVEGAALQMLAAECAYIGCEGDYLKWLGILADEWSDTYNGPRLGRVSDLASGWGDKSWKNSYDIVFLANTILENAPGRYAERPIEFLDWSGFFCERVGLF